MGASPSRAQPRSVTCWPRPRGSPSARPGRCARSTSAFAIAEAPAVAAVATARKLASLFWCLLTREQDYAFGQPSLTRKKLRRLELAAGAPARKSQVRAGAGLRDNETRDAERALAIQAENAYYRTLADWKSTGPAKAGASVTPGRAYIGPRRAKPRGRPQAPDVCASLRSIARAHHQDPTRAATEPALDFHPSVVRP
jgi:hypothetical protein